MKRELKVQGHRCSFKRRICIARLIPMKRELKGFSPGFYHSSSVQIARLIPMKRELKDLDAGRLVLAGATDRKAHPDEKGTESISW